MIERVNSSRPANFCSSTKQEAGKPILKVQSKQKLLFSEDEPSASVQITHLSLHWRISENTR